MKIQIDLDTLLDRLFVAGLALAVWACIGLGGWLIYQGFKLS